MVGTDRQDFVGTVTVAEAQVNEMGPYTLSIPLAMANNTKAREVLSQEDCYAMLSQFPFLALPILNHWAVALCSFGSQLETCSLVLSHLGLVL